MNFFFQLVYTQIVNVLFALNNVFISVINALPDGNKTIDLVGMGAQLITDAEGENPEVENASVSVSAAHFKHENPEDDYLLVSCGTDSQQDRKGFYLKQYKNGNAVPLIMTKVYTSTEDAQNDLFLEPGETYKCNGHYMYKQ